MENNLFYEPGLKKRHRASARFAFLTKLALIVSVSFLFWFLGNMLAKGIPAFKQAYINIPVKINKTSLDNPRKAVDKKIRKLISKAWLRDLPKYIKKHPELMDKTSSLWVLADDNVDQYLKEHNNKLKSKQVIIIKKLLKEDKCELRFNTIFFTHGDSKIPENSGFKSAIIGSILTLLVTMCFAFIIGVMTAIYLEEFAPKNRFTEFIEININNLAAIPSILFGLLGLAIFINVFGLPRSSPLVGGLTLGIMTLPIIIVSSRAALRSVPASIREAGFGLGLTKWQIVKDHVLPLAFPGILTGSIIGLAQAMGETAPLIIVGMIAFIPDASLNVMDAATVMPAQIFTWAGMPEIAYVERTSAAILVLLSILLSLNGIAIYLRKKYEIKW